MLLNPSNIVSTDNLEKKERHNTASTWKLVEIWRPKYLGTIDAIPSQIAVALQDFCFAHFLPHRLR